MNSSWPSTNWTVFKRHLWDNQGNLNKDLMILKKCVSYFFSPVPVNCGYVFKRSLSYHLRYELKYFQMKWSDNCFKIIWSERGYRLNKITVLCSRYTGVSYTSHSSYITFEILQNKEVKIKTLLTATHLYLFNYTYTLWRNSL